MIVNYQDRKFTDICSLCCEIYALCRSINYSEHCQKMSSVVWWQPVVCVLLILLVGSLVVFFIRQRRKARGAPLPTKEAPDVTV